jgi:protein Mpv17
MAVSRLWDRYILNTFPLLHTVLLAVLLTVTLRIALSFHFHYGARPVLTLCVVSALLASISDTLAQMTEVIRTRSRSAVFRAKDSVVIGEIELQEKTPSPVGSPTVFAWTGSDRHVDFDFPRLVRFMAYGFAFAPIAVRPSSVWLC